MNKDLGTYELIQQYLNGRLSGDQLRDFEKRLSSENDFRNYVESHQIADALIKQKELNVVRNELKKIHQENLNSGGSWKLMSMILIGLVVGLFTWKYFSDESDKIENEISANNETIIIQESVDLEKDIDAELESKMDDIKVAVSDDTEKNRMEILNRNAADKHSTMVDEIDRQLMAEMNKKSVQNELLKGSEKPNELLPISEVKINSNSNESETINVDCEPFEFQLDLEVYPSCPGKKEGVVQVKNTNFPSIYQYAIDHSSEQSHGVFTHLSIGEHTVFVVDERGCKSYPTEVNVTERACDIIISPSQEVFWEIPMEFTQEKNALLRVYDAKGGNLVYNNKLSESEPTIWNGRDGNDRFLPMGLYIYNISVGEIQFTGEISIVN